MSNHRELFEGLLEAGRALEELPQAKVAKAEAEAALAVAKEELDSANITIMLRDDEIGRLNDQLSAREVALVDATFRADKAEETLRALRRMLGSEPPVVVEHVDEVKAEVVPDGLDDEAARLPGEPAPMAPVASSAPAESMSSVTEPATLTSATYSALELALEEDTGYDWGWRERSVPGL